MNIEEKTKMAHEYAMKHGKSDTIGDRTNMILHAWDYADAMEAEYNKRIKAKAEKDAEESRVFFEKLTKNEDGLCKHIHTTLNRGECFDCGEKLNSTDSSQLEWQPDWSVAPESANYWAMDEDACCNWYGKEPEMIVIRNQWDFGDVLKSSPSFNYQGDWKDSLRKRPK